MYWQTAEFNEDITKYNYVQLADWIERCRLVVNWNEYIRLEKSREEYLADLDGFCKEWEAHYQWHEETYKRNSVYKSEKFKKALVYIQFRKRVSFVFDYGAGIETKPITAYENQTSSFFKKKKIEEAFLKVWGDTYDLVQDIFVSDESKPIEMLGIDKKTKKPKRRTYKEKIDDIFTEQFFNDWEISIRALKKRTKLYTDTFEDFIKTCENEDEYEIKVETRTRKNSYKQALDDLGVPHSTYNQWQTDYQCEANMDKKFFVNMCFALALPLSMAEQLLELNGFSIKNSKRQFDIICEMAFRIGFNRDMTIDLIEKWNDEKTYEFEEKGKKYKPVPNLISSR